MTTAQTPCIHAPCLKAPLQPHGLPSGVACITASATPVAAAVPLIAAAPVATAIAPYSTAFAPLPVCADPILLPPPGFQPQHLANPFPATHNIFHPASVSPTFW